MSAVTTLNNNPDSLWKILPRSATTLERNLLKVTSSDEMRRAAMLIPQVKRELEPEEWLPFLLIEYGAAEAAKLFKDWRKLLDYIKSMRGYIGTPLSVEEMAKLMRYDASIWEEPEASVHFPEFQMNLGGMEPLLSRICTLRKLVNTVKPVRCRFRRVFNDAWDERQMIWDDSEFGSFWDAESGVDILPLGIYGDFRSDDQFLVSLGQVFTQNLEMLPILLTDSSDPQAGYPLVLAEKFYRSMSSSEFFPLLDAEAFDGDLLDDPGKRLATAQAMFVLLDSELSTVWHQSYPAPVSADVGFPVVDYDGYDGDVQGDPVTPFVGEADAPDIDLETMQLDEVSHVSETDGNGDADVLDTDPLDGGDAGGSTMDTEEV